MTIPTTTASLKVLTPGSKTFVDKHHINKFVQTKMHPKEGTKIELQRDLSDFVRSVRFPGLDLSDLPDLPIFVI